MHAQDTQPDGRTQQTRGVCSPYCQCGWREQGLIREGGLRQLYSKTRERQCHRKRASQAASEGAYHDGIRKKRGAGGRYLMDIKQKAEEARDHHDLKRSGHTTELYKGVQYRPPSRYHRNGGGVLQGYSGCGSGRHPFVYGGG